MNIISKKIFNKNKIKSLIQQFINASEKVIVKGLEDEVEINTLPIIKDNIINNIVNDFKEIEITNLNKLTENEKEKILDKFEKLYKKENRELENKYKEYIKNEIDNISSELGNNQKDEIKIEIFDFIQMNIDNQKKLPDDNLIKQKIEYYINELNGTQEIIPELQNIMNDNINDNINNNSNDNLDLNNPENDNINSIDVDSKQKKFTIEYSTSEGQQAIDELAKVMNGVSNFKIEYINTTQTANKHSRLKKIANKKILAIADLFGYIQSLGFDAEIVKNNIVATYFEGNTPFVLNGNSDTIFYYPNELYASRLKKIADQQLLLPAPQENLLPEGKDDNTDVGFYIVTEGPDIHKEDTFQNAENWLLNNRKNIMSREVINNSFIEGDKWDNYEKELYEKLSNIRYNDGPKQDMNFKVVEITLPNNKFVLDLYDQWLEKSSYFFKSYTENTSLEEVRKNKEKGESDGK